MSGPPTAADRRALALAGDTRREGVLRFARGYTRHRVSRHLDGLWVCGLAGARAALARRPLLFVSNHVAWWDALLLVVLDEALGGLGWAVMDARNLRGLPFLGWLGGLPLERGSPERGAECLRNCADLLDRPGRALWFFPQGRQRPAHLRPLDLRHGVEIMHAHNPVDVVAVSIDYVFLESPRPAAVVRFSEPIAAATLTGSTLRPALEAELLAGLAAIDAATVAATDGHRARTRPADPLPGFTALVRPVGFFTGNGLGARLMRSADRGGRRAG